MELTDLQRLLAKAFFVSPSALELANSVEEITRISFNVDLIEIRTVIGIDRTNGYMNIEDRVHQLGNYSKELFPFLCSELEGISVVELDLPHSEPAHKIYYALRDANDKRNNEELNNEYRDFWSYIYKNLMSYGKHLSYRYTPSQTSISN